MGLDSYVSPCIQICKLDESNICVGCKRTKEEITKWMRYSHEERMAIMRRLGYGKRKYKSERGSKRTDA